MKAPISYYGGKQRMMKTILSVLYQSPNWDLDGVYCEPFFGGGAVFFGKEPQKYETINDINDSLITFYRVVKDKDGFLKVKEMLDKTPCSRSVFDRTAEILRGDVEADDVEKAWAVFAHLNMAFGHSWFGGYGFAVKGGHSPGRFFNKKRDFTDEICSRLDHVDIECRDALWVIGSRDRDRTLFYIDPPYAGTCQRYVGHHYGDDDLARLCCALKGISGKFVMSGFHHPALDEAVAANGWCSRDVSQRYGMQSLDDSGAKRWKTEVIVANFPFGVKTA